MSTKYPELFAALAAPFEPHEVKTRAAQGGRQLSYITARTAMNRLDTVLGPENWWDRYIPGDKSVQCLLTICLPDGKEITKSDAGGYAGMADEGDDDKSGYSDAFKRVGAKFGVGRYLYRDGVPNFARDPEPSPAVGRHPGVEVPAARRQPEPALEDGSRDHRDLAPRQAGAPRTGKALFAWVKEQEQVHGDGLLKALNDWATARGLPGRMVDWDADQAAEGHAEACRLIEGKRSRSGAPAPQAAREEQPARDGGRRPDDPNEGKEDPLLGNRPRSPKACYAWIKRIEEFHEVALLKYVNNWAKLNEYPSRVGDFDEAQVAECVREVERKMASMGRNDTPGGGDAPTSPRPESKWGSGRAARDVPAGSDIEILQVRLSAIVGELADLNPNKGTLEYRDRHFLALAEVNREYVAKYPGEELVESIVDCLDAGQLKDLIAVATDIREVARLGL